MRKILYNKQEGKMNEEVASRMKDEMRGEMKDDVRGDMKGVKQGEVKGDVQKEKGDGVQDVDGQACGSARQKGMEELVRKLEELCGEMAVVKGYMVALQMPLMDRCNTWVDGRTVQKLLHINGHTLKEMRENGTMPYSQLGKHIFYNVEDMDGLLRNHYVMGVKAGGKDE